LSDSEDYCSEEELGISPDSSDYDSLLLEDSITFFGMLNTTFFVGY